MFVVRIAALACLVFCQAYTPLSQHLSNLKPHSKVYVSTSSFVTMFTCSREKKNVLSVPRWSCHCLVASMGAFGRMLTSLYPVVYYNVIGINVML